MTLSIGAMVTGDSRAKFSVFVRQLITGHLAQEFPRPHAIQFAKHIIFPDKGTGYDYVFMQVERLFCECY